ncbi:hypothetical protein H4R20_004745, partial [Coemansia guatemalensis]
MVISFIVYAVRRHAIISTKTGTKPVAVSNGKELNALTSTIEQLGTQLSLLQTQMEALCRTHDADRELIKTLLRENRLLSARHFDNNSPSSNGSGSGNVISSGSGSANGNGNVISSGSGSANGNGNC